MRLQGSVGIITTDGSKVKARSGFASPNTEVAVVFVTVRTSLSLQDTSRRLLATLLKHEGLIYIKVTRNVNARSPRH